MSHELATIPAPDSSTGELPDEVTNTPEFAAICMEIAELEQMLLANDPQMPAYLQRIHMNLLKYPELVHIIQPEQRATIIDGLMQQTSVMLSESVAKASKTTKTKQLKFDDADDI